MNVQSKLNVTFHVPSQNKDSISKLDIKKAQNSPPNPKKGNKNHLQSSEQAKFARAIDQTDTRNLKEMTKTLGPLTPILTTPLNLIEHLITKFQNN